MAADATRLSELRQELGDMTWLLGGSRRRRAAQQLAKLAHKGMPEAVTTLADALGTGTDQCVSAIAATALRSLPEGPAQDALCHLAIEEGHKAVLIVASEAGYLPQDPAARAAFLALSGQWDACETCDLDGTLLRSAYEAAPAELRRRIAEAARAAGRTQWVKVAVGGSRLRRLAEMTFEEWEAVLALLCRPEHAAEAWRLAQEAPPVHARELLLRLADTQALPENDRDDYGRLRSLAELCTDEAPFDSEAAIWPATLRGHEDRVHSLAITPDGALLASGGGDSTIRLWHLPGGEPAATLRGHQDTVHSLAITPDGALLASGGGVFDKTVRLWHLPGGELAATLRGHESWVRSLAMSPGGALLASGGGYSTIDLWHLPGGKRAATLRGHEDRVHSLAITPDGALLASGAWDKTIRLWHLPGGEPAATLRGHEGWVTSLAITSGGALLASGSLDKTIRLWHLPGGEPRATLRGHEGGVRSLAITPGGALLASGSLDKTIRLWHLPGGEPAATLRGHEDSVSSLAVTPSGELLASGSDDKTIRLWHSEVAVLAGTPVAVLARRHDHLLTLSRTPDLAASARAWLGFMFALVERHRRYDIDVEVSAHVEVGEFDIEIES